ncbi:MAG: hypothetical protein H8E03_00625 [Pelagibacteraceae bacterium]|nr:hypothetical protein [Pelagibacteraceae bacterium]
MTEYVECDELINIANDCNSFKELEHKLGNIDRNTLNRVFEYNKIDKVDFIFNNMPLALQNKNFMQNYRKYEEQYKNHTVVSVDILAEQRDTCDLTIRTYHNFATNAGVIIHNSKATLAAEDVRFARTIERIQRIIISELTKIGIVHLYVQGYTDADLVNFELGLTNPSTIYEEEKIELWNNKTSLASSMIQDGLVSTEWIYKNIFGFSDDEIKNEDDKIIFDYKQKFRREQIETEGNDPAKSGESQGTPSDMAAGRTGHELDGEIGPEGGSPPGGHEGAGRPKEGPKYGKDGSARGRDPLGAHDKKKGGSGSPKYGKALALSHLDKLKGSLLKPHVKILNESEEVAEEYEKELKS